MKSEKFGLSQKTIDQIRQVLTKNPKVQRVILYGSRAKGNYKSGSDIDLTLQAPGLSLSDLMKLDNEIDELLLPYKVDLSLFHQIENPSLVEHIQRVGVDFA